MRVPFPLVLLFLVSYGWVATVFAAPPINFDAWAATNGKVSAPCAVGFTCTVNVSDVGILQQIIVDAKGNRSIQLIVAGADGRGGYVSTESFTSASNTGKSGISVKQRVKQTTGVSLLDETVVINTGTANVIGAPAIQINQKVTHTARAGTSFASTMNLNEQRSATGATTGTYLDIREDLTGSNVWSTGVAAAGTDKYVWVTRKVDGVYVPKAGTASLPRASGNFGMGGGAMGGMGTTTTTDPVGGSMTWTAGNQLQVVWGAINCAGCQRSGGGGGMAGGGGGMMGLNGSLVSFQSYNNLSDSAAAVYTRALGQTAPINWLSTPFGTAPTF